MNLKILSNQELDHSLMSWVKTEKKALNTIISHIAEVDLRKLYLDYAYPSLRAYLEERMGYDGGSAQRRIDAARLSHTVPSVVECLQKGEIKLAQVTVLQRSLREVKDQRISKETKAELLEAIKNKSVNETQVIVAQTLNIEIKQVPKITHQADESVRLDVTLSKSQWEKLGRMRELLSHAVPSGDWRDLLEYLSDKVIQQKTGKAVTSEKPSSRLSLYQLKKSILKQNRSCEFKTKDGKTRGSRWNLQIDHIQPKWAGGQDAPENLRVLCGNHNRHVYRWQANIRAV